MTFKKQLILRDYYNELWKSSIAVTYKRNFKNINNVAFIDGWFNTFWIIPFKFYYQQ